MISSRVVIPVRSPLIVTCRVRPGASAAQQGLFSFPISHALNQATGVCALYQISNFIETNVDRQYINT
jgi:hypothetical protein